jgi:plastocyanin
MRQRLHVRYGAASLAVVVLFLGAWGGTLSAKIKPKVQRAGPVIVVLQHLEFMPATVKIHPGQTVEWKWEDSPVAHDVSFRTFHSPLKTTGTWSHTFRKRGTYQYECTIHVGMVGTVIVQ